MSLLHIIVPAPHYVTLRRSYLLRDELSCRKMLMVSWQYM